MKLKRLITIGCAALLAAAFFGEHNLSDAELIPYSDTVEEENTMTAMEFASELKLGWNLGNTFDAPEGETAWGNPVTTKELIQKVKELGFETIRIPISWGKHVSSAPEYTVDTAFFDRVDTVVNDALDAGLHVIINTHHDNELYTPTPENADGAKEYLTAIWTQIGNHFANAPYTLIFETMNEPRVAGSSYEWNIELGNSDCKAALQVLNELNQTALDAIRATGGKNADRFVMIPAYAASPNAATINLFHLPTDSAEEKLLVSLHSYAPYRFALASPGVSEFNFQGEREIQYILKSVNHFFVKKGIPVVFGEMGCVNRNNPEDRYQWAKTFVSCASEYGIPCIWWDNGYIAGAGENFALIDRRNCIVYDQSQCVYQGLMDGLVSE